ncbi:RAB6-interacting golgin [Sceloporus undulatus]|uniref:RAB6-interacting golgin n=1 Tax=Sceloporus undulatus TaxID=8520 RepID=UPI001C4DBF85|nr:RAB6-interacting golgin [Sceloporus undulatus]
MAERGWAGFSERELRRFQGRLKDSSELLSEQQHQSFVSQKPKHLQCKNPVQQMCEKMELPDEVPLSPLKQKLSGPKVNCSSPHPSQSSSQSLTIREYQDTRNQEMRQSSNGDFLSAPSHKLGEKKLELLEKSRWEILQQEQKLLEEKNKRKKALLAKAIAERSKKTQAETVKLKKIQKQLQALDDMVSADIGILRNRIDQASLDYSCARKRYDKAESEYVSAKLDLQKKSELKEQLTEHLSTIIQQNELCKTQKLEELMQQLEVEADEENLQLEIEVEQMVQQQKVEGRKQLGKSQKFTPVGVENTAFQASIKGHDNKNHMAAETLKEQPTNLHTTDQDQTVISVTKETIAHVVCKH